MMASKRKEDGGATLDGDLAAKATGRVSAKQAAVKVLEDAGGPMKATEIAERVLATDGVQLSGKTPGATIQAMLAVENKKGKDGLFKRTKPGTYALREKVPA